MFYKVRILNKNGKLIKTLTSEALSKRHWGLFEEKLKPSPRKKNKFNEFKKVRKEKNNYSLDFYNYGLEGY